MGGQRPPLPWVDAWMDACVDPTKRARRDRALARVNAKAEPEPDVTWRLVRGVWRAVLSTSTTPHYTP